MEVRVEDTFSTPVSLEVSHVEGTLGQGVVTYRPHPMNCYRQSFLRNHSRAVHELDNNTSDSHYPFLVWLH